MRLVLLLLLALFGCSAGSSVTGYAGEDAWTTLSGIPLQLRVSKFAKPNTITAVALPPGAEAPTGPAEAGTRLSVTLQGLACEVSVLGRVEEEVTRSRPDTEVRRTTPAGTRTIRGLVVHVGCGDQPVPGTDASLHGARSRTGTPWALGFLVLGICAGVLLEKDRNVTGVLVGGLALIASAVFSFWWFQGLFCLTYALLFAGHVLAGILSTRGNQVFQIASVSGAVIGTAIAPLIWPLWSGFGPICAILFGAGVAVLALVGSSFAIED